MILSGACFLFCVRALQAHGDAWADEDASNKFSDGAFRRSRSTETGWLAFDDDGPQETPQVGRNDGSRVALRGRIHPTLGSKGRGSIGSWPVLFEFSTTARPETSLQRSEAL